MNAPSCLRNGVSTNRFLSKEGVKISFARCAFPRHIRACFHDYKGSRILTSFWVKVQQFEGNAHST